MAIGGTWEEPKAGEARRARLITYVLDYDDLLAGASCVLPLERAPRPLRIVRGDAGAPPALRPGELVVGDRWLSSSHAAVERRGDDDVIVDGGSRNGTWVNGRRVDEHRLRDGDLVEIGHSLFCYREVPAPAAALVTGGEPRLGPTRTVCPEVAQVADELARVAPSRVSILFLGETGAGKEGAAASVHAWSGRRGELRTVDCGAIPETLFESTFFGHRKGAFTGAAEARAGEIVQADGGTLFLDEVGNLGWSSQAKLLRVLEEGKVTPLGAPAAVAADVRTVAATNRDLFKDERFRPDLLRRLAGFVARLPPLRARREDLGLLAAHLLRTAGVTRAACAAPAGRRLFTGAFPGNIRELRDALRAAVLLAGDGPIEPHHLPAAPDDAPAPPTPGATPSAEQLAAVLRETQGNVVHAAARLGTHPRQVYRWLKRHGLSADDYRN